MAGSAVTQLNVKVGVSGLDKLPKLSASLNRLGVDTVKAGTNTKKLSLNLKEWEKTTVTSISRNQQLSAAWKELAANVQFGSNRFKEATAEAKRLDASLAKMQGRKGGGMGRMARTAGAVAGAGVFGGPEGAIGAAIGGLMPGGGPISAAVGGAIGAQVGMVRQAIGSTAEYAAALGLQRKALRLVIADNDRYAKSQEFLTRKSKELAIPQDVIVRQFTSLTASVKGAGKSVSDAEKVFESIAAGIRGTGGSLEDMKAAMRATSQVFSKGKVSAEELRQQIGERLPGAFTIFAESIGKTPAQLDKMLEQGQVTLDDFMTFADELTERYGKNAIALAASSEAAGDRLATSMSELKDTIGSTLIPIGAAFQESFSSMINQIGESEDALMILEGTLKTVGAAAFATFASVRFLTRSLVDLVRISGELAMGNFGKALEIVKEGLKDTADQAKEDFKTLASIFSDDGDDSLTGSIVKTDKKLTNLGETSTGVWAAMKAGAQSYVASMKSVAEQIADVMKNAFESMTDALAKFVMTGKMNFADFARSVIADLTKMFIRAQMLSMFKGLGGLFGGGGNIANKVVGNIGSQVGNALGGHITDVGLSNSGVYTDWDIGPAPNALGNVYGKNGIVPFAKGGIVKSPRIFPFKNGIGLMGEAGPEAIMPLRRGAGGRLGVEASGGGTSVVVNVDASGSTVEGDAQEARNLGRAISSAVQQELVRQRRPGGLLSA